jgi:hypothetical protein
MLYGPVYLDTCEPIKKAIIIAMLLFGGKCFFQINDEEFIYASTSISAH